MSFHSAQDETQFLATSLDALARLDVTLKLGTDFDEYKSILADGRPDHQIGAPFDPKVHALDKSNSVWVIGRDKSGRLMHTQALRLVDVGPGTLAQYLGRGFKLFPPSGLPIDFRKSRFRAGPGAQRITGRVCYHGEVWIGGEPGQYRGTGLSSILGRFAFLTALQTFAPDHVFGFIPQPVAHKGFVERQGYMHTDPSSLRWFVNGKEKPLEGLMVYMSAEDMRFVLDIPIADVVKEIQEKSATKAA